MKPEDKARNKAMKLEVAHNIWVACDGDQAALQLRAEETPDVDTRTGDCLAVAANSIKLAEAVRSLPVMRDLNKPHMGQTLYTATVRTARGFAEQPFAYHKNPL